MREGRRTTRKISFILVIIAFISIGGWLSFANYRQQQLINKVPASIRESVDFPIYVPSHDYQIEAQSYTKSNGVVNFKVTENGNIFLFTEQSLPNNFDLSRYVNGIGISEPKEMNVPSGKALIGEVLNRKVLIISSPNTLITITSSSDVVALEALANNVSTTK
jgi:hypothetical protein